MSRKENKQVPMDKCYKFKNFLYTSGKVVFVIQSTGQGKKLFDKEMEKRRKERKENESK